VQQQCSPLDALDYGSMRQEHSHVAFLGWGYIALMVLLIRSFLPEGTLGLKKYTWNMGITSVSIFGMIFSFPMMGYKALSIGLLLLFLVLSCLLVFYFLQDFRKTNPKGVSKSFVLAAFFFYLLSGIGPIALGPIVILFGKTPVYYLAVYYYLHFLYNGFFVFAIFGLVMKYMESQIKLEGPVRTQKGAGKFFLWSFIACVPAYALSALWLEPHWIVFLIGGVSATLQLAGFMYFLPYLNLVAKKLRGFIKILFSISMISFGFKLVMQFFSAFPPLALKTYQAKSFVVIGYIHLVVLGFFSAFLLAWIISSGVLKLNNFIADWLSGCSCQGFW